MQTLLRRDSKRPTMTVLDYGIGTDRSEFFEWRGSSNRHENWPAL